jgi:predicted nucleotidyltransferase
MRLEHTSLTKLKSDILRIAQKYLTTDEYRVFFFGSRVIGRGSERSDIDIGIEGNAPVPRAVLEKIREELEELPVLYKFDVVDFYHLRPEFKKVALARIEPLSP